MSRFFMKGSVLEESEKIMMNIPGFRYSNKLDSCVLEVIGYSQLVKKLQRNRRR